MFNLLRNYFKRGTSTQAIVQAELTRYQPTPRELQQTADELGLGVQVGDLTPGKRYIVKKIGSRWKVLDQHGNAVHSSRTRIGAVDWMGKAV